MILKDTALTDSILTRHRDPWWVYTTVRLVRVINTNYGYTLPGLVHISPRFGILLMCMFVSIVFVIVDLVYTAKSVSHWGASGSSPSDFQSGVNPFWRVSTNLRSDRQWSDTD